MKKLILSIAVFSLCCSACVEDDIMIVNAPCEWSATFSAVPDTCFDLPRNPNGSVFTAPHKAGFSFRLPNFNPQKEGEIYLTKVSQPDFGDVFLTRHNLCEDQILSGETIASGNFIDLSSNKDGNLLYLSDIRTLIFYDINSEIIDTIYTSSFINDVFWVNESTCAISVYTEESNGYRYVICDTAGQVLDTLPIPFGSTSNQNGNYFAWHEFEGPLHIYNTEDFGLVKLVPRPEGFQGAIRTSWVDNERVLLLETKKLSILNIETEEESVLLDYSNCENIGFYSAASDPFDSNRILINRFDHFYDTNGQLLRQEHISYYNIATGEEQILELE